MSNRREEFISVVIPAFNEEHRILPTLHRIDEYLRERFNDFEIIVVNDGSTDNTADVIKKAAENFVLLKYLGFRQNMGKGYALRQGVNVSVGNVILISDADLSTPIEEVEKLFAEFNNGYEIVIGSRGMKSSEIITRQPWYRECMGKMFNRMIRILLLKEFKDTQCGFKLFKGDVGRMIFKKAVVNRFAYDVEILYLGEKAGFRIKEVPVKWINSPHSKVRLIQDSIQMIKDVLRIRFRKYNLRKK